MLTLITGTPGAGKTLYALQYVKARAEAEKRAVYQSGVADCILPWEILDNPEKWASCPPGSLILIDEAQRVFRPRGTASAVPAYVEALETHRHHGFDIVLTTQHPNLVDANVRRLVGQHFHVVRRFGAQRATIYEWPSAREIGKAQLSDALRHEFGFPKDAFGWYKSAEVHTHKRKIPFRVLFLLASPLIIGAMVFGVWSSVKGYMGLGDKPMPDALKAVGPGVQVSYSAGPLSADAYVARNKPRLPGLLHTAPVYDEVTAPTRAPVPVACISSGERCECYSQDATLLPTEMDYCRWAVARGTFYNFDPNGKATSAGGRSTGNAAPATPPAAAAPKSRVDAATIKAGRAT